MGENGIGFFVRCQLVKEDAKSCISAQSKFSSAENV
jgi:hypothetical protein